MTIIKNEKEYVEIAFPFRNGRYMITDGGNSRVSRLMNYHFHSAQHKKRGTNVSMLFATDIIKTGTSLRKFLPTRNEEYPVFGETVYSPMSGTIVRVVNDIDDNVPYSGDYPYNTGNHVVIRAGELYLLLGHLMKGSIAVAEGDQVSRNDFIGNAGNSGMSERPHLHMQLMKSDDGNYWKGTGCSITFNKRNLYKNRFINI